MLETLRRAVDGCRGGEFDAMTTAPVQKSVLNDAGIAFTGHTEYLARRTGTPRAAATAKPCALIVAGAAPVSRATRTIGSAPGGGGAARCGHAASVGPVSDDELFYLMSRGIPEKEAERLIDMDEVARLADHLLLLEHGSVIASGALQETLARLDLPTDSLPEWARDVRHHLVVEPMDWAELARRGDAWMSYWDRTVRGRGVPR